ncbi:MFS transporter [Microbacterium keratanolyticum]|uniref:MFS transporter n=1 Tax=Microbacterium keratanolyticum TaxID=67574 RepID=UPI00362C0959
MKHAGHLPAQFTRVSWASVVVQLAEQIAVVALPLAAVLLLGVGATETALLQPAQTLPFLLLALPLGALIDRTSPRPVLVAAALTRAATFGGVAFLIATDALSFSALMALGFVGAIGALGFSVGVPVCVPLLVEPEQLLDANRWIELGRSVAFVSGPVLGGAFVALLGTDKAFVVATMACLAALSLLLKLDFGALRNQRKHVSSVVLAGASSSFSGTPFCDRSLSRRWFSTSDGSFCTRCSSCMRRTS